MDTKLKNRRKLGFFLAAVTILGAAFFMIYNYHTIYRKAVSEAQKTYTTSLSDREYLESFLEFSYVLYNQEISSKTGEAKMSQEEISDAVITCGSFGKCLRFPVTKKESSLLRQTS